MRLDRNFVDYLYHETMDIYADELKDYMMVM